MFWRTPRTCTSPARGGPTACSNGPPCCACSTPRRRARAFRRISTETKNRILARTPMINARVTGLRSVELGVPDLDKAAAFYRNVWGLEDVVSTGDTLHLRGTGAEHHVLTLRQRPKATFLGVHFAAASSNAVNRRNDEARAQGGKMGAAPGALPREEGGG